MATHSLLPILLALDDLTEGALADEFFDEVLGPFGRHDDVFFSDDVVAVRQVVPVVVELAAVLGDFC